MMKCAACGHSWLEGRAIEITPARPSTLPDITELHFEPDHEIRRLVDASREAQESFAARRSRRRRAVAAWTAFTLAVVAPFAVAYGMPETAVRIAPGMMAVYDWMGRDVNIYGLDIRKVETQHLETDGTRVIAIKGEIVNASGSVRKIPWLRFGLRDSGKVEVYSWQLDTAARPLQPGESTSFVTRVASPPATAGNIEIRFARIDEIGSNPAP
jgi:hypothetical protein